MSFYIYYAKIKDDLFVAILPNGTIEQDDPVYLYSKKQFSSYRVKNVICMEDGEDRFDFNDGYYKFEGSSLKGYRELSLRRKAPTGEPSTITLTRHYHQPYAAIPVSNPPKVWTGSIDFHRWAKDESFIVIAPKGLGVEKPIVSIWQWTSDNSGTPKTLSYWTGKQQSSKENPTQFSFQQGDFYTLKCSEESTGGLSVNISEPSNKDVTQKALKLSAKIEIGAEHVFSPARPTLEKITFDCSFPTSKPNLPRYTGALPFPADLIETLTFSAAYVDHAAYYAKFASKQFEKLEKSFQLLDKKSEARGLKIIKLESEHCSKSEEHRLLSIKFAGLEKQLEEVQRRAEEKERSLSSQLKETRETLTVAEARVKHLEGYIKVDADSDKKREADWAEKKKTSESVFLEVSKKLEESQHYAERLSKKIIERDTKIISIEAEVKHLEQLRAKDKITITTLQTDLRKAEGSNKELTEKIRITQIKVTETETQIETLTRQIRSFRVDVEILEQENEALLKSKKEWIESANAAQRNIDAIECERKTIERNLEETKDIVRANEKDLDAKRAQIKTLRTEMKILRGESYSTTTTTGTKTGSIATTVTEITISK